MLYLGNVSLTCFKKFPCVFAEVNPTIMASLDTRNGACWRLITSRCCPVLDPTFNTIGKPFLDMVS